MKKVIPLKVANKVFDNMLTASSTRVADDWTEEVLYKPGTTKISNKFFKNKVTRFTYKCRCDGCYKSKTTSTRRKIEKFLSDLNDYLQKK